MAEEQDHSESTSTALNQQDRVQTEDPASEPVMELARQLLRCMEDQKRKGGLPSRPLSSQGEQRRRAVILGMV